MRKLLALMGFAACVMSAQVDQPAAYRWLGDGEPLHQAWAAHWIGEKNDQAKIDELTRILSTPERTEDWQAAKLAAMDALIRMGGTAPLVYLEPLTDSYPTEVLILAARALEDNSALLLKLLDRQFNYEAFVAIGNLLTPRRVPGFALRSMKEFCVMDTIYVFSPGQRSDVGSGWAGDSVGTRVPDKEGWPPVGTYTLAAFQARGRTAMLADGKHPIGYSRQEGKTYNDIGFMTFGSEASRSTCSRSAEFLAAYLDVETSRLPLQAEATLRVIWKSPEQYVNEVGLFFRSQREAYMTLVKRVVARGYVSAGDGEGLSLYIRPYVTDFREVQQPALPGVTSLTGNGFSGIPGWR